MAANQKRPVDRAALGNHLARLLPDALTDAGGVALCVQAWRADLEMMRQTQTEERVEAHVAQMAERRTRALEWLAEHPEDMVLASCMGILRTNDFDPYLDALAAADPTGHTPYVAGTRAWTLSVFGRVDEALAVIDRAREHAPRSAALLGIEADLLLQAGDGRAALGRLDKALEFTARLEHPGVVLSRFALSSLLPGALSVEHRERLLELFERGPGPSTTSRSEASTPSFEPTPSSSCCWRRTARGPRPWPSPATPDGPTTA